MSEIHDPFTHQSSPICSSNRASEKVRELYGSLVAFGKAIVPRNDCQAREQSAEHLTATANLRRTLEYPYYDTKGALSIPSEVNVLERLAKACEPPAEHWENMFSHLLEVFRQYPSHDVVGARDLVLSVSGSAIDVLLWESSILASEWLQCRAALIEYSTKLDLLLPKNHFAVVSGPSKPICLTPDSSGLFSFAVSTPTSGGPKSPGSTHFQNSQNVSRSDWTDARWDVDTLDALIDMPILVNDGIAVSSPWEHAQYSQLSGTVLPALYGWIYYGQILAPSFGIYVRVVALLSSRHISVEERRASGSGTREQTRV